VAVPLPRVGDWAFGLGVTLHQVASLDSQSPLKGLRYSQVGFDVAAARVIIPAFSVGADIRARYAKNNYSSLWAFCGSIGIFYAPQPGVTYGFMFQGLVSFINYPYYQTTDIFDLTRSNLPRTYQAGMSMRYPENPADPQIVTICFTNQKVIGVGGLEYKMGVEKYASWFDPAITVKDGRMSVPQAPGRVLRARPIRGNSWLHCRRRRARRSAPSSAAVSTYSARPAICIATTLGATAGRPWRLPASFAPTCRSSRAERGSTGREDV
jgi:hypothetical protein